MQISRETKDAIAEAFAGFVSEDDIKASLRRAVKNGDLMYGANPDFGRMGRKRLHFEPITLAIGAVFAGMSVAAVVTVVGMAMTVVGALTGNKTLMQIGGVMSMAGGVMSLASGAFSGAAGAGIDAAAGEGVANAAGYGAETAFMGSEGASLTTGLSESAMTSGLAEANALTGGVDVTAPIAGESGGLINSSQAATANAAPLDLSGNAQQLAKPVVDGATNPGQTSAATANTQGANLSAIDPGKKSWMEQMLGGLDKETRTALLNGASGLFTGWTKEQELEFQKNRQAYVEDMNNKQYANANSQPTWVPTKPVGLINSATAPRAA